MKSYMLSLIIAFFGITAMNAQLKTPAASPSCKTVQSVGLSEVTLEYSRPSAKGRQIFGDLVPMNKMWRTGANKNTMITFSTPVTIGGAEVKAGTYAIFTKPGASDWDVYFYTDTENWGTPEKWDDAKVAASVKAKPVKMASKTESFLVTIGNLTNNGGQIQMIWENSMIPVDFMVPTKETVQKNIEQMLAGPSNRDYYNMAGFYLDEKMNMDKALEYINKSISMDYEKFWSVRRKALIQAGLGKYSDAIKTAERSIELAKEAGNDDYVNNNTKSIKIWQAKK